MKKKVIVLVAAPNIIGGITSFFNTAKKYYDNNIEYVIRGPRNNKQVKNKIVEFNRLFYDLVIFIFKIINPNVKIVHINTSLGKRGVPRDLTFIYLAKLLNKSTIVFFHGWNRGIEKEIDNGQFDLFKKYISKIDVAITLSNRSRKKLRKWGFNNTIYNETTLIDDKEIKDWSEPNIKDKMNEIKNRENLEFLFLARMIKEKGIYEAIDIFKMLSERYSNTNFNIAGDGPELENVKNYIEKERVKNVKFYGYVTGNDKIDLLKKSHILLFPSYNEGMPIAVLEAMAFGLVIVTRPVGGLIDFFTDDMGIMIDTFEPKIFVDNIIKLLGKDLLNISINNYQYAKEHFMHLLQ